MPWDSATLYVADVRDDGALGRPRRIAGGDGSAVFQPEWGPDGQLYFVWDETGWGQLYRWHGKQHRARARRARRGAVRGRNGCSARAAMRCTPTAGSAWSRSVRGMPLFEVRQTRGGAQCVTAWRCRNRPHASTIPLPVGDGFAALVSRPLAAPAIMRIGKGGLQLRSPNARQTVEPGVHQHGRGASQFRRPDGSPSTASTIAPEAPTLSRTEGRRCRPLSSWRTAAPPVHDRRRPEDAHAVLHEPRLRRARRQLFRQHRLRPRLSPAPRRRMGHRRCRRLRGRRAPSGQAGLADAEQHRHRRRQRRRLHDPDGARHHGAFRRRQQPLRRFRSGTAARRTRTSSSRAICTA